MDKNEVIEKVKEYKLLVSKHFDVDQIVLFSSYAQNNPREDSDIDVAVVVNTIDSDIFTYAPLL